MVVEVTTTDNRRKVEAAVIEATRLGMDAAAAHYQMAVYKAHNNHYTTRRFKNTLAVRQSIRRTDPVQERGGWAVRVGTKLIEPLYWELGHHNLFTRKYERREIWKPTAIATRKAIQNAYARVVQRVMRAHK
jgi:hypothetical protein